MTSSSSVVKKSEQIYLSSALLMYLLSTCPLLLIYVLFVLIPANGAGIDSTMHYLLLSIDKPNDDKDKIYSFLSRRQPILAEKYHTLLIINIAYCCLLLALDISAFASIWCWPKIIFSHLIALAVLTSGYAIPFALLAYTIIYDGLKNEIEEIILSAKQSANNENLSLMQTKLQCCIVPTLGGGDSNICIYEASSDCGSQLCNQIIHKNLLYVSCSCYLLLFIVGLLGIFVQYFVAKKQRKHPNDIDEHLVATEKSNRMVSRSTLTKFDRLSRRTVKRNSNKFADSSASDRREESSGFCRIWALEYEYSDDESNTNVDVSRIE